MFVVVYKCVHNDCENDITYEFSMYQTRLLAYEAMLDLFLDVTLNHNIEVRDYLRENPKTKSNIIQYLSEETIALFDWEYKRKGNYDLCWVCESSSDSHFSFVTKTEGDEIKDIVEDIGFPTWKP